MASSIMTMPFLFPFLMILGQFQPLVIPGERLNYEVTSARFGRMGRAQFSVTAQANGTLRLGFDFDARVLLFKASDHTFSELDAVTLRTVRYAKRERSPVGSRDEDVFIDHANATWSENGRFQRLAADDALDELSFIYLIRNMALAPGEEVVLTRHFDAVRNPVRLRAIAGDSEADIVEMSVPDRRQKSGVSTLRFYLARNARRTPLRIESTMPVAGRVVMTLIR
jgi:hypothetical protein